MSNQNKYLEDGHQKFNSESNNSNHNGKTQNQQQDIDLLKRESYNQSNDNPSSSKQYQSEVINSDRTQYNSLPLDRKISDYRYDANIKPKKSILKQSKSFTDMSNYMLQPRVDQFGNPINEQKKQHIVINQEVEEYQVENWKDFNQDMSQERDCCTCTLI
ncbi:hypothetical protein PPERSA_06480 [Pseudocohnilembus persalinus]|uniref:Uncharacterized protein n=1 Tax=Pseudocohnilembus persalinus TaxID=266149 RepID=A0A0V0QRA4_PSEPJ|nr:hypothetical protein PPERSA_06480 [Pseudocohnilembus persalinus]|eukprot:KRX04846.1 hypothetical protein PPERSA_06480 [Pseudocohnilembus persalinus]